MIEADNLTCGHGRADVLHGVSLRAGAGEMVGVLGPNGAGKSTLLLALAGVLEARSGAVRVMGEDAAGLGSGERARLAASVPQRADTAFPLKCFSVALMGRYPHLSFFGVYSDRDREVAGRAMEETGCEGLRERPVDAISGGEFQRVLMARALAQETRILLLDEPASSLDIAATIQVFDLLKDKCRGGGAVVCAVHDLNLAALYCDRLVFIKDGRVVYEGSTEEVFREAVLAEVFGTAVEISRHPCTGAPQVLFVPGSVSRRGAAGLSADLDESGHGRSEGVGDNG